MSGGLLKATPAFFVLRMRFWIDFFHVGTFWSLRRVRLSRYGIRLSSSEPGHGPVLLLFMVRVEALALGSERPGQVQQLPRGG